MSIFKEFQSKFPFKIKSVLTDNGSEFMLHFSKYLEKENIKHYHTYPRCPKMNAHCERFNRTIRE
jgi:transposase InsO family protein